MRKGVKEFVLSHCDIRPFAHPTPLLTPLPYFPANSASMVSTMLLRPISSSSQQDYGINSGIKCYTVHFFADHICLQIRHQDLREYFTTIFYPKSSSQQVY